MVTRVAIAPTILVGHETVLVTPMKSMSLISRAGGAGWRVMPSQRSSRSKRSPSTPTCLLVFSFLRSRPRSSFRSPITDWVKVVARRSQVRTSSDVLDSSLQRQAWFRDYAERTDLGQANIRHWEPGVDSEAVAATVTVELAFGVDQRLGMSRGDARNHLRRRFEVLGGLPIFTSMVGNNTHRLLDRNEFRGFTLADDIAPLIFVNTNDDTLAGQIFTFLHEYAHVARRQSGISDEDPTRSGLDGIEGWCNAVAAEVLAPRADLQNHFVPSVELTAELDRLAGRYIASTLVILLQGLRDIGLVSRDGFDRQLYAAERGRVEELARRQPRSDGGDFYRNQPFRVGEKLSRVVLSEVASGSASFKEAFALLGLRNVNQLNEYARSLGQPDVSDRQQRLDRSRRIRTTGSPSRQASGLGSKPRTWPVKSRRSRQSGMSCSCRTMN